MDAEGCLCAVGQEREKTVEDAQAARRRERLSEVRDESLCVIVSVIDAVV